MWRLTISFNDHNSCTFDVIDDELIPELITPDFIEMDPESPELAKMVANVGNMVAKNDTNLPLSPIFAKFPLNNHYNVKDGVA
ncbi:hypothetical protein TNCV_2519071 [Trichonephila clavipes]|nr:hypothetical protein TNCV_2519071 [Trichonephila clavipes]